MFRKALKLLVAAAFFIFNASAVISHPAEQQSVSAIPLTAATPLAAEITRGQTQTFKINLAPGDYAEVIFEWQGMNLSVMFFDPLGRKLIPAEVTVTSPGPLSFSILAETAGDYKLEVSTPTRQKIVGKYGLRLTEPRFPTPADQTRLAAQKRIVEAQNATSVETKVQLYTEALTLLQSINDLAGVARVHMLLGDDYRSIRNKETAQANFQAAAANYTSAAIAWSKSNNKRGEAYATLSLAHLYRGGSINESLAIYQQAELLFAQINDRRGQADALYGRAFALMLISRTAEALAVLQQALPLRRAIEDRLGQASILNMMADAHLKLGNANESLTVYDEAAKAIQGLDHPLLEAVLINGRALVTDDLGNWESAKLEYLHALSVIESVLGKPILDVCSSNPPTSTTSPCRSAASILINLGEAYNSLGEPDNALRELKKSLTIRDALGQALDQAEVRVHLGYTYFLLGKTDNALEYYQEALSFQSQDPKGTALTNTYIGMAQVANKKPKIALEYYLKALPILEKSGDKRAIAITVDKLAIAYSLTGNQSEAKREYARALDLWRQIKDPDGEALTLYNIAESERQNDNLAAAIQSSEAAIKLIESLRTRITSEKFRVSYLADKKRYYEMAVDLNMSRASSPDDPSIAAALEWNEMSRARTLLDSLNESFVEHGAAKQTTKPKITELMRQRNDLVNRLSARAQARTTLLSATRQDQSSIDLINKDIDALTAKLEELDTRIKKQAPQLSNIVKPRPATIAQVQQQLDPDTLLLEFALGEKRSYAWVVTNDGIRGVKLAPREQIESLANRLLHAITERNRNDDPKETSANRKARWDKADKEYSDTAAALSKLIIEPIAPHLQRERLVVVADGTLQQVPFGLLPDPTTPGYLIAKHEIVSLPSASVLALQRQELANRKQAPLGVAVVADPVFELKDQRVAEALASANKRRKNKTPSAISTLTTKPQNETLISALRSVGADASLHRLIMSRTEAAEIARVVPTNQLYEALDFQANRSLIMNGGLSKYRYVHLATHGVIDLERPELSGIVLSMVDENGKEQDGYVRLYEIYNLNLPAELVVLSACQTGVGKQIKGEGLIALTRGFMYAGAARIIASLWKVDDSATAALMAQFYKEMFTNGKKPAAALRAAQKYISDQKRWNSPYFWAGFVLQGEWR